MSSLNRDVFAYIQFFGDLAVETFCSVKGFRDCFTGVSINIWLVLTLHLSVAVVSVDVRRGGNSHSCFKKSPHQDRALRRLTGHNQPWTH